MNTLSEKCFTSGLRHIHVQDKDSQVASTQVWVGVGSKDESKGIEGLSHFIEHLLFKGTKKRGVGEIANEVEKMGGEINAYTSLDRTVYYITGSAKFFENNLEILSDMVSNSIFDQSEVNLEREVVLEEIRRGNDDPSRSAYNNLFSMVFKSHPYGRPVIGYDRVIEKVTRKEILAYFHKYYVTGNTTVITVGPHSFKDSHTLVQKLFKSYKKGKSPKRISRPLSKQSKFRFHSLPFDLNETYTLIGFPIPSAKDVETAARIDLLTAVLGQGDSSRLKRRLQENEGVANGVYSGSFSGIEASLGIIGGSVPKGSFKQAIHSFLEEIKRISEEPISSEELERVKTNYLSHLIYSSETVDGQADRLGFYATAVGDLKGEEAYLQAIEKVTSEELLETAKTLLKPDLLNFEVLYPESEKKEIQESFLKKEIAAIKAPPQVKKQKKTKSDSSVELITLDNGLRVALRKHTNVPTVSLQLSSLGGVRFETDETNGAYNLVSHLLERGTKNLSAEAFANSVESLASSVSAFSGKNTIGLSLTSLKKNIAPTLELFKEAALFPAFKEEEIERAKRLVIQEIRTEEDQVSSICVKNFIQTLYKTHPYRLKANGTEESVSSLARNHLISSWETALTPKNTVIGVSGDFNRNQMIEFCEGLFKEIPMRNEPLPSPKEEANLSESKEIITHKQKEQAHAIVGFLGIRNTDPDVPTLSVINSILSGQGGRLFLELRDKQGLAYTVCPIHFEGIERGYFGIYIGCAPDKLEHSIQEMKKELEKLIEGPISASELKRSKQYLIGRLAIGMQRNRSYAASLSLDELYGNGYDHYAKAAAEINRVSVQDIRRLSEALFKKQHSVTSRVTPK